MDSEKQYTKRLVVRFVKFEKALAMQVLEQEGIEPKSEGRVRVVSVPDLEWNAVNLRGNYKSMDFHLASRDFNSNEQRDEWLDATIEAITNELFSTGSGMLKYGKPCLVRDSKYDEWEERTFIGKSPVDVSDGMNYIVVSEDNRCVVTYMYAKPLPIKTRPISDGDVYTWVE